MPTPLDRAVALLQSGQIDAAAKGFREVLRTSPELALAHACLGHCEIRLGREQEAWESLTVACKLPEANARAFSDLAWLALKRGDESIADAAAKRALSLKPENASAHFTLAQLLFRRLEFDQAEAEFALASKLNPTLIESRLALATKAFEEQDFLGASRHYAACGRARPQDADAWLNCGLSLIRAGILPQARAALERAIAIAPARPRAATLLALLLADYGLPDAELIPAFERAVMLSPNAAALRLRLASLLFNEQEFPRARQHLQRVRELEPDNLLARWFEFRMPDDVVAADESTCMLFLERWRQGIANFEALDWSDPQLARQAGDIATAMTSFYLSYLGKPLVDEQRRNARMLRRLATAAGWTRDENAPRPPSFRKRRRIAIFASALIAHSISVVWSSTFLALDPDEFEIGMFYADTAEDANTLHWRERAARFESGARPVQAWIDLLRTFDADVAIFADIGVGRIAQAVACVRNAPVQVALWAHPMTSGMATIDYFLSAGACEPDNADAHYTETMIKLPHLGAFIDTPAATTIPVKPSVASGATRLLCTQSADKLHPRHDALFARMLRAVPNATLDILCSKPTRVADLLASRMRHAFSAFDVDFDARCSVHRGQPIDVYHRFLAEADVCLDSLDFSGCITSLDALWRDLPIVTLPGELMRGRQTFGMLKILHLDDLIATDEDDYVDIAVRLASDARRRDELARRIRASKSRLYEDREVPAALAQFLRTVERPGAAA